MAMPDRRPTVKEQLHARADALPDDVAWDDVRLLVAAKAAVESGRASIRAGKSYSHEEIGREFGFAR
ncbi:MAG: hypothetical protein IT303_09380 [Dehalococcoidia bacterium]|nr:hypothetical protein [Dehalococcoidia bacterium]